MMTAPTPSLFEAEALVYIRPVASAELTNLLPANAMDRIQHTDDLFVVLTAEGERLAIVEGRDEAFKTAIAHNLKPVSVH